MAVCREKGPLVCRPSPECKTRLALNSCPVGLFGECDCLVGRGDQRIRPLDVDRFVSRECSDVRGRKEENPENEPQLWGPEGSPARAGGAHRSGRGKWARPRSFVPTPTKRRRPSRRSLRRTLRVCARRRHAWSSSASTRSSDWRTMPGALMSFMAQHTLLVLVGVTFAALSSCSAQAHNAGMSTSRIVIHGRTLDVEINALGRDYERATGVRLTEAASG